MTDDETLPDDFYRDLTTQEVIVLTMLIVEGRTREAIATAVDSLAHATRGDIVIDVETIPAMLDQLKTDGLIALDESTGIYSPLGDCCWHVQCRIDDMRSAVGYAMQTGFFFTGWTSFGLASSDKERAA